MAVAVVLVAIGCGGSDVRHAPEGVTAPDACKDFIIELCETLIVPCVAREGERISTVECILAVKDEGIDCDAADAVRSVNELYEECLSGDLASTSCEDLAVSRLPPSCQMQIQFR